MTGKPVRLAPPDLKLAITRQLWRWGLILWHKTMC